MKLIGSMESKHDQRWMKLVAFICIAILTLITLVALPAQKAEAATSAPIKIGTKCLDDRNYDTTNGAIVQLWNCNGASAQSWTLESDGTIRVQGVCLQVNNIGREPGTVVNLWSCVENAQQQQWAILPNGTITSLISGLCLSVVGGQVVDAARIEVAACRPSSAAQTWVVASSPAPTITAPGTQSSTVGVATGFKPAATGGLGRITWEASGLPTGMSFNYSTGVILGTPTAAGSFAVKLTATDSRGNASNATFTWTVTAAAVGTKRYLDCSATSAGTGTQAAPWNTLAGPSGFTFQPGDQLLVKRGTTCVGELSPDGSGSAAAPILLSSYGTGALPVIAANGATRSAVLLRNQSYWIVENIEVTNDAAAEARRSGVLVVVDDGSTQRGVTVRNTVVHDVMGWSNRGADVVAFYFSQGIGAHTLTEGSRIIGLTIANNYVYDVHASGVGIYGKEHGNDNIVKNDFVHIVGNDVVRTSNDGIVVCGSNSPLVEFNTSDSAGHEAIAPGNIAGIWAWNDDNPTFQYNEGSNVVANTFDSEAWDCDGYITGYCTYQYNYDHGNLGGIFLDCVGCGGGLKTTIIYRYNVSVNDCRTVTNSGNLVATWFYNNTIDCGTRTPDMNFSDHAYVANNLFIGPAGASLGTSANFNSNLYRGFTAPAGDPNPLTSDPLLQDGVPGSTSVGYQSVGGYLNKHGSPLSQTGISVPNQGTQDYFRNVISRTSPHRGAYGSITTQPRTYVDDTASSIVYNGAWTTVADPGSKGGSYRTTTSGTATATITFTGRIFSLVAPQGPDAAVLSVSIDGRPAQDVQLYSPSAASGKRVFTAPVLDNGVHTVTIKRSETPELRSSSVRVSLDGFEYHVQ